MRIKIIDLLNKIEAEEEMPSKIKTFDTTFGIIGNNYYAASGDFIDVNLFEFIHDAEDLNSFVEIIEEDKKINKFDIESENGRYRLKFNSCSYSLNEINYIILSKLNEVIDAVNKLKVDD